MMPLVDVAALVTGLGRWRFFDIARCCFAGGLGMRVLRLGLFFRAGPGGCLVCLFLLAVGKILDGFGGVGVAGWLFVCHG